MTVRLVALIKGRRVALPPAVIILILALFLFALFLISFAYSLGTFIITSFSFHTGLGDGEEHCFPERILQSRRHVTGIQLAPSPECLPSPRLPSSLLFELLGLERISLALIWRLMWEALLQAISNQLEHRHPLSPFKTGLCLSVGISGEWKSKHRIRHPNINAIFMCYQLTLAFEMLLKMHAGCE